MTLPSHLKVLSPIQQAMVINGIERELAAAEAWTRAAVTASDRIRIRTRITRHKKLIWQAKHGR